MVIMDELENIELLSNVLHAIYEDLPQPQKRK